MINKIKNTKHTNSFKPALTGLLVILVITNFISTYSDLSDMDQKIDEDFVSVFVDADYVPTGSFKDIVNDRVNDAFNSTIRYRFAKINPNHDYSKIRLNLFPDATFDIVDGKVKGNPWSEVRLTIENEIISGAIETGGRHFVIEDLENGIHLIYEFDQTKIPDELPPLITFNEDITEQSNEPLADDFGEIEVLVAYTDDARIAQGGTQKILKLIFDSINDTNNGYANSQVTQRVKLVYTLEVNYAETGNSALDLTRLQNPSDGFIDEPHKWRDIYGADAVVLLVNASDACGIAYQMNPPSVLFRDKAFAVVNRRCSTAQFSFGHELGHLMSARHDWFVDSMNNSPYSYNHGHVYNFTPKWRTIMAYSNACGACVRINYWSNPNVYYNGLPTGVPESRVNSTDNHKTLENTKPYSSNWMTHAINDSSHIAYGVTTCGSKDFKCQILPHEFVSVSGTIKVGGGGYSGTPINVSWRCGNRQNFKDYVEIYVDDNSHLWGTPDFCLKIGDEFNLTAGHKYDFRGPSLNGGNPGTFYLNKTCVVPKDNLKITEDTVLCPGTYYIDDKGAFGALIIDAKDVELDCNKAIIIGTNNSYPKTGIVVSKNNAVVKNCIVQNYFAGIYLSYVTNSRIFNNVVKDVSSYGIQIDESNFANVSKNNISNSSFVGISSFGAENVFVSDNSLQNIEYAAIFFIDSSNFANISKNTISTSGVGVYLDGVSNVVISYNSIDKSNDGIRSDNSNFVQILNNRMVDSTNDGIQIYNSNSTNILNNRMENSSNYRGLQIMSSENNVVKNNYVCKANLFNWDIYEENVQNLTRDNNTCFRTNGNDIGDIGCTFKCG